jgi:glycine/D-amino acid oxidase-like deaminating enzyme
LERDQRFHVGDPVEIDVAVMGGGIAGLWLLNRLRLLGFDALLFESKALGTGQTLAAQGILHSGVKYAFDKRMGSTAQALSAMPKIWLDCIAGRGEVDLRGTQILADNQCVFTTGGLTSRVASAIAGKAFRSVFEPIQPGDLPEVFRARGFKGDVFRLQEPVIATKTAIVALRDHCPRPGAFCASVKELRRQGASVTEIVFDDARQTRIRPRACVFTAGEGNEWFAHQLGFDKNKVTQRRPLRMFLARGLPHRVYAHWLVPEPKPRLTITTHDLNGENIWYIGGNIAEKTVGMSPAEALRHAHTELTGVFPELDWKRVRWAIHDVNRAEPSANKLLPKGPTLKTAGNAALAWPAKLVLAPALASETLHWLEQQNISPSNRTTELPFPAAEPGKYPWEEVREWIQL